jgi:formamidopyrimidine-DNA glycosylase
MFELPEYANLARQLRATVTGKRVAAGTLGNSPHKFVWYNRTPDEFASLTRGKTAGEAYSRGRWLFLPLEPGYVLVFGECGGKIVFHDHSCPLPKKYHLSVEFDDGTALSATTQMWGAMELYEKGQELERRYICDMRPTPTGPTFTLDYFNSLVDECVRGEKRNVKSLLTQDQLIPGLGNAIAQDIMFEAKLHPRHAVGSLDPVQREALYRAILEKMSEVTDAGGRNDELDLFGEPGGYPRIMDKSAVGGKCPDCEATIEKIQYLGGACYFCPSCQI